MKTQKFAHRAIITLLLIQLLCLSMASIALGVQDNIVKIGSPNSTFRMCLPLDDGSFYLMGQNEQDISDWFGLVSADGQLEWQISSLDRSFFGEAFLMDGKAYVFVRRLAIPNRPYDPNDPEMIPYLLPIDPSGKTGEPIDFPNWTHYATLLKTSSGVLFYGDEYVGDEQYLRLAMYDNNFVLVWEAKEKVEVSFCIDCVQTGDGFLLLGPNDEKQTASIIKYDLHGSLQWVHTYPINAFAKKMQIMGERIIILGHRMNALHEHGAEYLFCLDSSGKVEWEKKLTEDEGSVQLDFIQLMPNGYMITGTRWFGHKPSEIVLVQLDAKSELLGTVDIAAMTNHVYVKPMADESLFLIGTNNTSGEKGIAYCFIDNISW